MVDLKLINVGFGNVVAASRVIAIVSPDSAPVKRIVGEARDRGMLIDATHGRRTRAVVIMERNRRRRWAETILARAEAARSTKGVAESEKKTACLNIKPGDSVKAKEGIMCPDQEDLYIGGWQGRVF